MGTHPIFESDFDCLTECWKSLLPPLKLPSALFSDDPHLLLMNITWTCMVQLLFQKIEAEALKQGLDIFVQFDHQTPLAIMGEGTAENPFLIPSRNQCRMIWLDKSGEAPGVQGLGAPFRVFWVWAEGDGNSPAGLNRCEYTG